MFNLYYSICILSVNPVLFTFFSDVVGTLLVYLPVVLALLYCTVHRRLQIYFCPCIKRASLDNPLVTWLLIDENKDNKISRFQNFRPTHTNLNRFGISNGYFLNRSQIYKNCRWIILPALKYVLFCPPITKQDCSYYSNESTSGKRLFPYVEHVSMLAWALDSMYKWSVNVSNLGLISHNLRTNGCTKLTPKKL